MSLSANTVFEVRRTGADTNGGGFVTGSSGTDWSQQNAAQYAVTDGVTNGTTTITSASANFGTDVVGNVVYVAGGTGSVTGSWYQIVTRSSASTITVDRSTGLTAGTGVTLNVGGALASPAVAQANASSVDNIIFVKYSPSAFPISTATTGVPGGAVRGVAFLCGYNTTRTIFNTDALQPTLQIQSGVSSVTIASTSATTQGCRNIVFDGNNQTSSVGSSMTVSHNCTFKNITGGCLPSGSIAVSCTFTGCSTAVPCPAPAFGCVATGNTITPFSGICINCISYGNTGATTDGFGTSSNFGAITLVNCVAYNNGRNGFFSNGAYMNVINCVSESNSAFGFAGNLAFGTVALFSCSAFGNTSGRINTTPIIIDTNPITPSASVFVNASAANFSLNNTTGSGALLRGDGYPTVLPGGFTSSFPDVGAAQHQDTGGGGAVRGIIEIG